MQFLIIFPPDLSLFEVPNKNAKRTRRVKNSRSQRCELLWVEHKKLSRRVVNFSYQVVVRAWIIFCQKVEKSISFIKSTFSRWNKFVFLLVVNLYRHSTWMVSESELPETSRQLVRKSALIGIGECLEPINGFLHNFPLNKNSSQPRMAFSRNLSATMNFPSASILPRLSCLIRWTAAKIYSLYVFPINVTRDWGSLECWKKLLSALNKHVLEKFRWMKVTQVWIKTMREHRAGLKKRSALEEFCKHSSTLLALDGH